MTEERIAKDRRDTKETQISVKLNIAGTGESVIGVENGMFAHLLSTLARHSLIDLEITAATTPGGIDSGLHHLVEDTGIMLGKVLKQAVGKGEGIRRAADIHMPLDETLAHAVIDFGGRGYYVHHGPEISGNDDLNGLSGYLIHHFLESMAREGQFNLHTRLLSGKSNHHKAEAIFKALARALRIALELDPRLGNHVMSEKGTISSDTPE